MRTAIFLLLAIALVLTGCPSNDPASPTGQESAQVTESEIADQPSIDVDAPTLEVTDIPSTMSEPRPDETDGIRHAAAFEGDVALEGSGVTGGGRKSNPFLVQIPASAGDLVQVHLRGSFDGGGIGTLTAQVSVPGYSTTISVPATGAWVYKAFYMPSSGTLEIRLFNGATYNGTLNVDAASMSYYAKSVPTPFADEPNADNDPATLTDRTLASTIPRAISTTRGLIQVNGGPIDTEEWYALEKGYNDPELKVTFDTYNHRYGHWSYELSFFDNFGRPLGLRTILKAPSAAKLFWLSKLPATNVIYMRVLATPNASSITTNAAYALHLVVTEVPLAINQIDHRQLAPFSNSFFLAVTGGAPSASAVWHWDYGGGATCVDTCDWTSTDVILSAPGRYAGSVWVQDGERVSRTVYFSYDLTCHRWPVFYSAWVGPNDYPGLAWFDPAIEGTLISSGGQPYAITAKGAGDVRSIDLWHRLGSTGQYATQLTATPHAGRIYIAFIDSSTNHLRLWVSSDAVPNQKNDWELVTLDERSVANLPIEIATSGDRVGVLYSTGQNGRDLRLAYSKNVIADRQLDWGTGIVHDEFVPSTHSLAANAGRWITAQRVPGTGQILISVARDLAPYTESHWNTHPLSATSSTASQANISLISVDGLLTGIYATPIANRYDFRLARSVVAVPQVSNDWNTSSIIPIGTTTSPKAAEPYHALVVAEGSYVVGFQLEFSSDVGLWRSCDLGPEGPTDWSRAKLASVNPYEDYPQNLLGLAAPGDGSMYALYLDSSFNGEVMRLHQLPLDLW